METKAVIRPDVYGRSLNRWARSAFIESIIVLMALFAGTFLFPARWLYIVTWQDRFWTALIGVVAYLFLCFLRLPDPPNNDERL